MLEIKSNELLNNDFEKKSYSLESEYHRQDDINEFEKYLYFDPIGDQIFGQVDQISNNLAEKKIEFEKSLKKAAETAKSSDIIEATRNLAEYSLHTTMVSKVASKTSQAIEKLTNLQ